VCLVVTPGSGEGRAHTVARRLARRLARQALGAIRKDFGDLASLSRWAESSRERFSAVLCVGGDATQSAAAGFARRHAIPFVPVPTGFGNLFAAVFGHPRAASRVVALLRSGAVRRVDMGIAGNEIFLSHRSYGFLDQVQEAVEAGRRQPKDRGKRLAAYYRTAMRAVWRTPLPRLRLEVDGVLVLEEAAMVTVANVETYRGFLSLTPAASPIDGQFDVFAIPRTSKAGLAWRLLLLKLRLPGRWRGVALYRGREVAVESNGRREVLKVLRHALPLLIPAGAVARLEERQAREDPPIQAVAPEIAGSAR
jgi:diacylglycerol kinase (ATP)